MSSLRECVRQALEKHIAIGHFNVSTLDGIWAVADAAQALKMPVIIGLSEGERDYVGVREAVAIVKSIREERGQDIFLNADHTYSLERVKEAIDAGFDAVIFDGAQLSLQENIDITKQCVKYAKTHKSASGNEILIEGELGFIGTSSKVLDAIPAGAVVGNAAMTSRKTRNASSARPAWTCWLRRSAIYTGHIGRGPGLEHRTGGGDSTATGIPLVLHGASSISADDIRKAVKAGVAIVHVNTELRLAYRSGLMKSLSENPDEIAPYKYLKRAKLAMQMVVEEKLKIVNSI